MSRRVTEQEYLANNGRRLQAIGDVEGLSVVKEVKFHKTFNGVYSMQWNFAGTKLAVGFGSGAIQIYDANGLTEKELRPSRQGGGAVMVIRFCPKDPDLLYAGTAEGFIYVFNVENGEQLDKIDEQGNEVNCMDFSVDGFNFITGGKDLDTRVYETKSNKLIRTYRGLGRRDSVMPTTDKVTGNTQRVFSLKCHCNNQFIFISGGWDNHIKIWDIRDNEGIKRSIMGPHIAGDSLDMKDNQILAGSWAALHALQLYDYTSGHVVKEINYPHSDGAFLYTSLFVNDKMVMAGGSGTNTLEVIEIEGSKSVGNYKVNGPVHASDSANNGRVISVGGSSDIFAILKLDELKKGRKK